MCQQILRLINVAVITVFTSQCNTGSDTRDSRVGTKVINSSNAETLSAEDLNQVREADFPTSEGTALQQEEVGDKLNDARDFYKNDASVDYSLNSGHVRQSPRDLIRTAIRSLATGQGLRLAPEDEICAGQKVRDVISARGDTFTWFYETDVAECLAKSLEGDGTKVLEKSGKLLVLLTATCSGKDYSKLDGKSLLEEAILETTCGYRRGEVVDLGTKFVIVMGARFLLDTPEHKNVRFDSLTKSARMTEDGQLCTVNLDGKANAASLAGCSELSYMSVQNSAKPELNRTLVSKFTLGKGSAKSTERFFDSASEIIVNNWSGNGRLDESKTKILFDMTDGKNKITITKY